MVQERAEAFWPPLRGEYRVGDPKSRVAVLTLASRMDSDLVGAAIVGSCKTENLGVEKVVANIISNPNIRFLIVCGSESRGHLPGDAILALHRGGLDGDGRISGARGAIPFIENLSHQAVARFQRQVELIDRIGLADPVEINLLIEEYRDKGVAFQEAPFYAVDRPRPRQIPAFGAGDVLMGQGVWLDSAAWLISSQGENADQTGEVI